MLNYTVCVFTTLRIQDHADIGSDLTVEGLNFVYLLFFLF